MSNVVSTEKVLYLGSFESTKNNSLAISTANEKGFSSQLWIKNPTNDLRDKVAKLDRGCFYNLNISLDEVSEFD